MKINLKRTVALALTLMLSLSIFMLPVYAEEISKSKYFLTVATSAGINVNAIEIHNSYTVSSGTGFTNAEMHTYVERKVLGLFWVKVDNGQPDKTWVDTSTSRAYAQVHSLVLPETGTYRATVEYRFYGSSGSESITKQQTVTY